MNAYRLMAMAMAVTTCATGLLLAACSAGLTSASPVTSRSPGSRHTGSSSAPTTSPTTPGDTVSVDAPIGSFPIPPGAQVMANDACDKQIIIELGSVTPGQASSFYLSALPRAGYKITGNTLLDGTGDGAQGPAAEIDFTGHGYQGQIAAVADLGALASTGPSPVSVPSNMATNFLTISLTPPGAAGCAASTGP